MKIILSVVALLLSSTATVWAEADDWIKKFESVTSGAYEARFEASFVLGRGEESVSMSMTGTIEQVDPRHMKSDVQATSSLGGMTVEMNIVSVADGNVLWAEVEGGGVEGLQVVKMDLPEDGAVQAPAAGAASAGLNPVQQLRTIVSLAQFELKSKSAGRVLLEGSVDASRLSDEKKKTVPAEILAQMRSIVLELDERNGAPRRLVVGGSEPLMTIAVPDYKLLTDEQKARKSFTYQPPSGAEVADLTTGRP